MVTALLGTGTEGTAAKGGIGEHPAVGGNIEHGPVVHTHAVGIGHLTALPLGGNTGATAQGDEGQRLHAAVTPQGAQAGVGDVGHTEIVGHKTVLHVLGDVIVDGTSLGDRIGETVGQFGAQSLDVGGKDDVGCQLTGKELGLDGVGLDLGGIHIGGNVLVGIFHPEGMVLGHGLLPVDGAGVGLAGADVSGLAVAVDDLQLALLEAVGRQGNKDTVGLAGDEELVAHLNGVADGDAGGHLALFLHDLHAAVQAAGAVQHLVADLGGVYRFLGQTGGKLGLLGEGAEEGAGQMLHTVDEDPGDTAFIHIGFQFFHGELGDLFLDAGQCLGLGIGELTGQAHHHLPLCQQIFLHTLGGGRVSQQGVNDGDGTVKITGLLQMLNVLGQTDARLLEIMILVHGKTSCNSKFTTL